MMRSMCLNVGIGVMSALANIAAADVTATSALTADGIVTIQGAVVELPGEPGSNVIGDYEWKVTAIATDNHLPTNNVVESDLLRSMDGFRDVGPLTNSVVGSGASFGQSGIVDDVMAVYGEVSVNGANAVEAQGGGTAFRDLDFYIPGNPADVVTMTFTADFDYEQILSRDNPEGHVHAFFAVTMTLAKPNGCGGLIELKKSISQELTVLAPEMPSETKINSDTISLVVPDLPRGSQYRLEVTAVASAYAFATEPKGACCLAQGICMVGTDSDCTAANGTYAGDGVSCAPNPCPPLLGDLNNDGFVNGLDVSIMVQNLLDC